MSSASIETLKRVQRKYKPYLLGFPNVTAVGVGPKVTDGKPTGTMAVKVYVRQKVPLSDLSEEERIPEKLDGMPTDVEVLAPLQAR